MAITAHRLVRTADRTPVVLVSVTVAALALAACGGGEKPPQGSTATPANTAAAAASATSASAAGLPTPAPGTPPAGATAAMLAEGDSIFHGLKAGGICQTCHGPEAAGGPLAPSLVDSEWLTGDGSYAFIQKRVTEGMPTPTPPYTAAMPPMGGAQLSPEQIQAVAAYVYSISHKGG
jgi:mono/diheme cytochrome c family protein